MRMSLLAKLPWVRRYALENERLRSKLTESRQQVRELLERQEQLDRDADYLRQAREYQVLLGERVQENRHPPDDAVR